MSDQFNLDQIPFTEEELSFFEDHAIDSRVAARRPYERWQVEPAGMGTRLTRESRKLFRDRYAYLSTGPTIAGWANQTTGWLINRNGIPGTKHVYPEIRGDKKIRTRQPTRHYHGSRPWQGIDELLAWSDWRREGFVHSSEWAARSGHLEASDPDHNDHDGIPCEGVHEHPNISKYTFCPNPKEWRHDTADHDHATAYKRASNRARHIRDKHDGADVTGPHPNGGHSHTAISDANELREHQKKFHGNRPQPDRHFHYRIATEEVAKRIDIHPWALERLDGARVVFFILEGCLKSDSVLTEIIEKGWPMSVFSVPSVTLWDKAGRPGELLADMPELEVMVERYLRPSGAAVIIVVDSDWADIPEVWTQARLVQGRLMRLLEGPSQPLPIVRICSPSPSDKIDPKTGRPKKIGVDDSRAGEKDEDGRRTGGKSIADLEVLLRTTLPDPRQIIDDLVKSPRARPRATETLLNLAAYSTPSKTGRRRYRSSIEKLIPSTGMKRNTAFRGAKDLKAAGAIDYRSEGFMGRPNDELSAVTMLIDYEPGPEHRMRLGDIDWFREVASDTNGREPQTTLDIQNGLDTKAALSANTEEAQAQ